MSQGSKPTPFLMKTYQLVEDHETDDVVSWSESGNTFVVWKHPEFARDVLPKYFRHDNFSSFVRQLNTYGFGKIGNKWEFGNEHFKRGRKELLVEIKRRKTISTAEKSVGGNSNNSTSNSGDDDMGSTSMRSKEGMTTTTDLSGENKKFKKENERLSYELAMAKKQCNELVAFLRGPLSVGSDQINHIIKHGSYASGFNTVHFGNDDNRVGEDESGSGASLKLFGVWLKEEEGKEKMKIGIKNGNSCHKRGREDEMGFSGPNKELKTVV